MTAQDPCTNSLLMEDLDGGRRNPNYVTTHDTAHLCDYQLDECEYHLSPLPLSPPLLSLVCLDRDTVWDWTVYRCLNFFHNDCKMTVYIALQLLSVQIVNESVLFSFNNAAKWYRFTSAHSDRIPETCIQPNHCGTQWPIWMNGRHPTGNFFTNIRLLETVKVSKR